MEWQYFGSSWGKLIVFNIIILLIVFMVSGWMVYFMCLGSFGVGIHYVVLSSAYAH